jgi:hypothetical protein
VRPSLLLVATLVACAPKVHPLQGERDFLKAQESEPLPSGWTPDAVLLVGPALEAELLREGGDYAVSKAPEKFDVPVPIVGTISLFPEVSEHEIRVDASRACRACAEVTVKGKGLVKLDKGGSGLSWSAGARGTVEFDLEPGEEGAQVITLVPRTDPGPAVEIRAPALPPLVGPALSAYAQSQAKAELAKSKPVELFEIPASSPVRARGLSVGRASGLELGVAVVGRHHGEPTSLPDVRDGWLLAVPADTLLGVIHKAGVEQDLVFGMAFEPRTLVFTDGGGFDLGLRVWRAGRNPRASDFVVHGIIDLGAHGNLVLRVAHAEEGPPTDRPLKPSLRKLILAKVSSLRQSFPVSKTITSKDLEVVVEATRLQTRPDLLLVFGDITLGDAKKGGVRLARP